MIELVIDGSFDEINISIFEDKGLVYDLFLVSQYTHSKILVNVLDYVFSSLGKSINKTEKLYCCIGPGRYTSLRVTLSMLKGMFFNKLNYVYGFSRLDIMAASIEYPNYFRILCEPSKSKAYFADYKKENGYIKRITSIEEKDREVILNTDLNIASINKGSLTKNIFTIDPSLIEKIEINNLIPVY